MKKFIVRRVLLGAMILFFVSMIIYSIERALPTSYVEGRARDMSMKQGAKPYDELVAELNASYGLDRSEERRVGKECRIGCRSRWSPYH